MNVPAPAPSRLARAIDQLVVAVAAALVTAALHLAVVLVWPLGYSIYRYAWDGHDELWMLPCAYVLVFLPIGVILAVVAMARNRGVPLVVAMGVWIALGVFSVLLLFSFIHGYAWLAVATGVGVRLGRRFAGRDAGVRRWAQRTALVLGGATVLAGGLAFTLPLRRERDELSSLPAPGEGARNVILIILDTVRGSSTSLGSATVATTPSLARWASKGVVFEQAFSTSSWTMPSHASIFTGLYPTQHEAGYLTPLTRDKRTIAEVLRDRGFATGGFTGNLAVTQSGSGLEQGFIRYRDLERSLPEVARHTTITQSEMVLRIVEDARYGRPVRRILRHLWRNNFEPTGAPRGHDRPSARDVIDEFLEWRETIGGARPYFAFLNLFDAHTPYPQSEATLAADEATDLTAYNAAIRYLDGELDRLISRLEARGDLSNTVVVVTSDHGEQFGEHHQVFHGNSLYTQVLHVPLLLLVPGTTGVRVSRQVSQRDLPRTLLDLAGASGPAVDSFPGVSLVPLWHSPPSVVGSPVIGELDRTLRAPAHLLNGHGPMKAVVNDSLHVIRDGNGRLSAYRYRTDADETLDLATDTLTSAPLRALLDQAAASQGLTWKSVGIRNIKAWPFNTRRR